MGQVLIRNLEDALIADYRVAAARAGRSLEAELRDALARARPDIRPSASELKALSAELRAMTPAVAQTDSTTLIRHDRDKRFAGSVSGETGDAARS